VQSVAVGVGHDGSVVGDGCGCGVDGRCGRVVHSGSRRVVQGGCWRVINGRRRCVVDGRSWRVVDGRCRSAVDRCVVNGRGGGHGVAALVTGGWGGHGDGQNAGDDLRSTQNINTLNFYNIAFHIQCIHVKLLTMHFT
jgi:hypothetical protein